MVNDNKDPFREYNRRVQRLSDRRQDGTGWAVVVALAIAVAVVGYFALNEKRDETPRRPSFNHEQHKD